MCVGVIGASSVGCPEVTRVLAQAGIDAVILEDARTDELADTASATGLEAVIVSGVDPVALLKGVREIRPKLPACPVIVVWPGASQGDPRRALRAGADALVNDCSLERELGPTVRAVCAGLTCVPLRHRAILDAEALSMREKQILGMLVRGFTNAEIAAKLFLAESTVKSHLSSAYAKLGVRSRQAAATMILDPHGGLGPGILAISAA